MIIIFDLDGTLANIEHRLHYINPPKYMHGDADEPKKDWKSFFRACVDDQPIHAICSLLSIILHYNSVSGDDAYEVWIVTGRSDMVRGETEEWLEKQGILWDKMLMRKNGDNREDSVLKEEWLKTGVIPKDRVLCVFDDRSQVVGMWRRNGLQCLQVADGEF